MSDRTDQGTGALLRAGSLGRAESTASPGLAERLLVIALSTPSQPEKPERYCRGDHVILRLPIAVTLPRSTEMTLPRNFRLTGSPRCWFGSLPTHES